MTGMVYLWMILTEREEAIEAGSVMLKGVVDGVETAGSGMELIP